ncbi:MAG: amylo-alpha-1,6-glucosidase [Bacteroidota bacterium]
MRPLLFVLPFPFFIFSCTYNRNLDAPITLDELTIEVHGPSREIAYTNKEAGTYYTETNGGHRTAWQGWYIMTNEMMEDYAIAVDGRELPKSTASLAFVSPLQIHRAYPLGVQETVTLLDSVDALVIQLDKVRGSRVSLRPTFSDSRAIGDYVVRYREGVLLIARQRHLQRNSRENYPVWIGMTFSDSRNLVTIATGKSIDRGFSPAGMTSSTGSSAVVILVAGDTEDATIRMAQRVAREYEALIAKRKHRMEKLLNGAFVRTDNERFDKAVHWAILSMDALVMNQTKRGIFAGLPWFNNYWGRDSFIALPGATLVTGRFSEAKEILRSFAEWQETNTKSPNYGRIPNLVTTTSIAYNTADGTPRFIIALEEYLNYSGDTAFVHELYPVVQHAIEGTIKYHTDSSFFLTHGDAETWMDAVGPEGPWSPRGNRANDIQALWIHQLQSSRRIAKTLKRENDEQQWGQLESTVTTNFKRAFVDTGLFMVYDHLKSDGSHDAQVRPNQLFTLSLLDDSLASKCFKKATEALVYRHGVASLWQDDANFHPYHHYEPFYVQDAAYHNGIVWTWLSGSWVDFAVKSGFQEIAFELTDNMVHQILERGAVGTLSELVDAAPRLGEAEPRLSGAFSQAWSLAEFIRNVYQSYFGVEVRQDTLLIHPRLPGGIREAKFNVWYHDSVVQIKLKSSADNSKVEIERAGVVTSESANIRKVGDIKFADPFVRPDLPALNGPSHRLLSNSEINARNPQAKVLSDISDPAGDDNGNGRYVYPGTPNLMPGSLDIRRFTVSEDDRNFLFKLQFENLSNPGWHPEYGFQLTYIAIAIDEDRKKDSGQRQVGMNSNYFLDQYRGFERMIHVGGGFRIVDDNRQTLAEYLPASGDEMHPLGNVESKSIEFSVPKELLGASPANWRYTVLVGAQDDHGGAGIGDFRDVRSTVGEWWGGGKKKASDSNVYDEVSSQ